jgi:hypothetical protein
MISDTAADRVLRHRFVTNLDIIREWTVAPYPIWSLQFSQRVEEAWSSYLMVREISDQTMERRLENTCNPFLKGGDLLSPTSTTIWRGELYFLLQLIQFQALPFTLLTTTFQAILCTFCLSEVLDHRNWHSIAIICVTTPFEIQNKDM